jgi:hypothetical protein
VQSQLVRAQRRMRRLHAVIQTQSDAKRARGFQTYSSIPTTYEGTEACFRQICKSLAEFVQLDSVERNLVGDIEDH